MVAVLLFFVCVLPIKRAILDIDSNFLARVLFQLFFISSLYCRAVQIKNFLQVQTKPSRM